VTSFVDIEARSVAGSDSHEDAFGSTPNMLVSVDGATGLAGERHTSFPSDAQWFSSRLARAVVEHATRPIPMREVLSRAIADCGTELNAMSVPGSADLPSASVVFARCGDEVLEVLSLGDCTAVVSMVDESVVVLADDAVGRSGAIGPLAVQIPHCDLGSECSRRIHPWSAGAGTQKAAPPKPSGERTGWGGSVGRSAVPCRFTCYRPR